MALDLLNELRHVHAQVPILDLKPTRLLRPEVSDAGVRIDAQLLRDLPLALVDDGRRDLDLEQRGLRLVQLDAILADELVHDLLIRRLCLPLFSEGPLDVVPLRQPMKTQAVVGQRLHGLGELSGETALCRRGGCRGGRSYD